MHRSHRATLSARRADMGQLRDTNLSLRGPVPRCPECRTSFVDEAALKKHVAVMHTQLPPADEEGSE